MLIYACSPQCNFVTQNVIYDAGSDLLCAGESTRIMEMYRSLWQEAIKEMGRCFSAVMDLIF